MLPNETVAALKAQSNCRATLKALAKLQQGQAAIRMARLGWEDPTACR
jgi:hypothetical protein